MIIIAFILSFFPVVFFHELGHFLVGLYLKAEPVQFTLGVGPVLWKKTANGILYSWNLFPIGGYVIFNTTQFPDLEPNKQALSPLKWILISLAGPLSNFIISFVIFFSLSLLILNSYEITELKSKTIGVPDSLIVYNSVAPAAAELFTKDIPSFFIQKGEVILDKDNKKITKETILKNYSYGKVRNLNFLLTIKLSFLRASSILVTYFTETTKAFINLFKGEGDFHGPLGIAQQADETLSLGYLSFFIFIASLSFALGYFNMLPIMLALDGGRALAALIEILIKKPLPKKAIIKLYQISWAGIFLLLFISLSNDLKNLFNF